MTNGNAYAKSNNLLAVMHAPAFIRKTVSSRINQVGDFVLADCDG